MTVPMDYFDGLYGAREDPYGFRDRWYERRKYALTVAALPRPAYPAALELACAEGELTRLLAPRCDRLLAVDGAAAAVDRARDRLADLDHVEVRQAVLPGGFPAGAYDLVVFSEVGYYLADDDLAALLDRCVAALPPGGDLVAVHWRGDGESHPVSGDEVHRRLRARPELRAVAGHVEDGFLLDVLERV